MSGEPFLLILDAAGVGQAIVDGKAYRVRRFGRQESWTAEDDPQRTIRLSLSIEASLDEAAQRDKIAGLERRLERERERLAEIHALFSEDHDG